MPWSVSESPCLHTVIALSSYVACEVSMRSNLGLCCLSPLSFAAAVLSAGVCQTLCLLKGCSAAWCHALGSEQQQEECWRRWDGGLLTVGCGILGEEGIQL